MQEKHFGFRIILPCLLFLTFGLVLSSGEAYGEERIPFTYPPFSAKKMPPVFFTHDQHSLCKLQNLYAIIIRISAIPLNGASWWADGALLLECSVEFREYNSRVWYIWSAVCIPSGWLRCRFFPAYPE